MWAEDQHKGKPQAMKTLVKKHSLLFKHGRDASTNTQNISVFFSHLNNMRKKNSWRKSSEKWMFCIRAMSAFHNIRPHVYVAMWLKPLYVLWRRLAFLAFIKLSSHWYCLWYSEREGAKITQYKSGNNSLGLCLLYLSSLDQINNLHFAICFHKQLSSHEDILPEIVLLFHLRHWIHK